MEGDAADRRAHVGGGRGVEGGRSRRAAWLRSAADLRQERQWRGVPLAADEVRRFRQRVDTTGVAPVVSHASYLINLAAAAPGLREQSIAAFVDELDRAHALGLLGVVIHPGTCTEGADRDGLLRIAAAIRVAFKARPRRRTMVLLEHTAGQGRALGHRFEHLRAIIEELSGSPRVGVCLDTFHLVASGYDIVSAEGYSRTFAEFEALVGFDRLHVIHANDSKRPCGSRVDRHEHIGQGCLGLEPFRRMLHDRRFAGRPMLIETEKTGRRGRADSIDLDPLDVANLETLRTLRARPIADC
jgi:deoxyribonuclease-4